MQVAQYVKAGHAIFLQMPGAMAKPVSGMLAT